MRTAGKETPRRVIGAVIVRFDEITSSNEYAKKLGAQGVREGLVVLADRQTGGVGRLKRKWHSPEGGLWLSILLKPRLSPTQVQKITLMAGVAVARALRDGCGTDARLKWPNDVLIKGKKVCGILTESALVGKKVKFVVVGIGLNVNNAIPRELKCTATSLKIETGGTADSGEFLSILLAEFESLYNLLGKDPERVLDLWSSMSDTIGRRVEVSGAKGKIMGTAEGISSDGSLRVRARGGKIEKIIAGDCRHI